MEIRLIDGSDPNVVQIAIHRDFKNSRFTMDVETIHRPKVSRVKIRNVRLKESKKYCGNHPSSCDIRPNGHTMTAKFLEGLDWVEFNDRINDTLDRLGIAANAQSSVCIIRKGNNRRIKYDYYLHPSNALPEWNKDEGDAYYKNYTGKVAPASDYPVGTPGSYERKKA